MGDITGITDINGNLVASYTYDPWGKVLDDELTAIGELNPFRYRSYYYDSDIQMYYLQSRYYDPEVGRFINSDDVNFIGATGSEISYNPFAYCENNPVNGWDPSGKLSIVTSMLIGAILGVLGVFILDVMLNLYYGAKTWYGRRSTIVSYISAAISGALSMISIKSGSKLLTASVSAATYALEQLSKGEKISIIMLIITVGFALVLDHVFAGNIDLSNRIGAIKTSRDKLKTLVSAKKITQYKNKIISNISGLIKGTFSTLLNNIISRVADELKILKGAAKKIKGVLKI